jgi:hypothetical protein
VFRGGRLKTSAMDGSRSSTQKRMECRQPRKARENKESVRMENVVLKPFDEKTKTKTKSISIFYRVIYIIKICNLGILFYQTLVF